MKKLLDEFKTFISKGNVLGLAIGIIIGGAFNDIVNSLINDVIMPVIGRLLSGVSFNSWYIPLTSEWPYKTFSEAQAAGAPMITIGNFISAVINFFIIALVLFFIMKAANKAAEVTKKKEEAAAAAPAEPSDEVKLLTEIRDALAKKQ